MRLKDGIAVSNRLLRLAIHNFGNSSILWNKRKESFDRTGVLQNQGGHPPPPQRRRYADNHARILRIADDFANRGRINYRPHNIDFCEHFQIFFILFKLFP